MFGARVVRQKRERERAERGLLDADSRPTVPYIKVDTIATSASKSSIRRFVITEKAPTSAFSWLKAATTAFTFKTLCLTVSQHELPSRGLLRDYEPSDGPF